MMNSECIVTLISVVSTGTNDIGEIIQDEKRKQAFALKKSVNQSEFFQASAAGYKPEIVLEISAFDYKGEIFCELESERYKIYRSYESKNSGRTELYLTAIVGETNGIASVG